MDAIKEAKYAEWTKDVKEWKESGLKQIDWCRLHNISLNTFKYRIKALNRAIAEKRLEQQTTSVRFAQVPTKEIDNGYMSSDSDQPSELVIELPGAGILAGSNTDINQLKMVLEVLRDVQ